MEKVFFFYNKLSIWLAFRSEDFFCHVPDITLPTKHKNLDLASPRRIKDFRHESLVKSQKICFRLVFNDIKLFTERNPRCRRSDMRKLVVVPCIIMFDKRVGLNFYEFDDLELLF